MHCTSCALNIDFDLEDFPGVVHASTNYPRSETVIEFDPGIVSVADLKGRIAKTGYDAGPYTLLQ